ncbi:MAG: hypothetical protein K5663_06890 [Clostridiales bacterium]|nr:hypothetical protein [Clostridiales bacterium]
MIKRLVSLLVAVILAFGSLCAFALEDKLEDALTQLNYYLTVFSDEERSEQVSLEEIADSLRLLGNYKYASGFFQYSNILIYLEQNDFIMADTFKKALKKNTRFAEYLREEEFREKYPAIGELDDLISYVDARIAENKGETDAAIELYETSSGFFDSMQRLLELGGGRTRDQYNNAVKLMNSGDYASAYSIFSKLEEYGGYEDSEAFAEFCRVMAVKLGINIENGTEDPSPSDENAGHWSSWSTDKPSGDVETESKIQYRARTFETQYRYRTLSRKTTKNQELKDATLISTKKVYGSWSSWKDSKVSKSATREVETKKVDVTEQVKQYSYSRYTYINKDGKKNSAPVDASKPDSGLHNYLRDGKWEYTTVDEPKKISKINSWKDYTSYAPGGGSAWWNEKVTTKTVVIGTKTQYRYRDITVERVYDVWSGWSEWQTDAVSASSKTQVETKNAYSPWSGWTDDEMTGSYDTQVETRTVYRYWIKE